MKEQHKLLEILEKIGLSQHESQVYLASLSLGSNTILNIGKESGLPRTTVYSIVESLKKKGLMFVEEKGFKKCYVPQNPKQLESVLEQRKDEFQKMLPEFSALYNLPESEGLIQYFEGFDSTKTVYNTLINDIKKNEEYLVIADQASWYEQDPKFFQNFMERRAKLPIKIRMLLQDTPLAREHKKFQKNWNLTIKLLPKGTHLNTDLVITPQHVMVQQFNPPIMALLINNQSIIKMHQQLFEVMWNALPE